MSRTTAAAAAVSLAVLVPRGASAQPEPGARYAEEPTAGLTLPTTGLAGEHDALAVTANPAGLQFLDGWQLALLVDSAGLDDEEATAPGQGWGLFAAGGIGGGVLPRLGWGLALEFLSPPRVALAPDPGDPTRFTLSTSLPVGRSAALGLAWHHFFDGSGPLGGLDTYDLGLSMRFGAHLAAGLVVRDLGQPEVAGVPVQRRYELELVGRPTGTDRLELGLGGRIGEIRTDFTDGDDIDGWLRASVRVARGVYLRGQVETRSLFRIVPAPAGPVTEATREHRITAGVELSFGGLGTATYGTGAIDDDGDFRAAGLSLVARISEKEVPSILSRPQRIERVELRGALGDRDLTRLIAHLRRVARDEAVVAVLVQIDDLAAGWASVDEIRRALADVRAHGKPVYAYMVAGTTKHYFLASIADRIYLDPAGGLRLTGMFATALYFKGLFDKLGILAQFEKIEEYKSAPEAYTRTGPTEPAFIMRNELYDSLYEHLVRSIARGRKLDPARVRVLIDSGPYTSGDLEKIPDLVDKVVTPDELTEELTRQLGASYPVSSAPQERAERWDYPTVAVIYIDGDIVDGKSSVIPILNIKLVGGQTIADAIAAARASGEVDAIVLRIDSPGGSAVASEMMAREVFKTRGVKPIICSLGNVAASGGYFAAAGCDTILADPMTVTGSIGIFNGKFDFSGLLSRLGVSWTFYRRGELADMDSMLQPFDPEELALMKRKLHYYYGRFIRYVAEGRGMTTAQVDKVGRGRVWTGVQAEQIDLVDGFGGIGDAIALAKRRIGLSPDDEVRLLLLPKQDAGFLSKLLGGLVLSKEERARQAERSLLEALLPRGADRALLEALPGSVWAQPGVPQARLPFSLVWER